MKKDSLLSLVPSGSEHRVQGQRTVALPGVTVDILTTRKIELQQWELRRLNDPYWRLYWPVSEGGVVEIDGEKTALKPGFMYLIPPHTTFSTTTTKPFGKWYAHFNLGPVADRVAPGIHRFPTSKAMRSVIPGLVEMSKKQEGVRFPWPTIQLVMSAVQCLPEEVWEKQHLDERVQRAMEFMHQHLGLKLTAEQVARHAGLSLRNLNHLFKQELNLAPMRVLLDYRLDEACRKLRHSQKSIDIIAEQCGLTNRYYLSRMLRQYRNTSPAAYRDESWG
ncbi:helix-turn-helix domain-containing protein [Prosthecobacter sp.]|uniref:AraC family transcriptional regulator n=1 Tax=Prosthecobacter sp. TaxID=1965333 RepID=UPI003783DDA7